MVFVNHRILVLYDDLFQEERLYNPQWRKRLDTIYIDSLYKLFQSFFIFFNFAKVMAQYFKNFYRKIINFDTRFR